MLNIAEIDFMLHTVCIFLQLREYFFFAEVFLKVWFLIFHFTIRSLKKKQLLFECGVLNRMKYLLYVFYDSAGTKETYCRS